MKRKVYDKLLKWKKEDNGSTALLVEGARRVGKSYIVEEFAKAEYKSYILIDFKMAGKKLDAIKSILDYSLEDLDDFFSALIMYSGKRLYERDSLIIFDEVQEYPRAREAIKFLVKDGRYDYIETGSLISIRENTENIQIPSEELSLQMHPMDFEEFLWALDKEYVWDYIKECFIKKKALGQAFHREVMLLFRKYLVVGGMPQAVEEFVKSGDLIKVDGKKRAILNLYKADIAKHDAKRNTRVGLLYDNLQGELKKHEKKYQISTIGKDVRYDNVAADFFWLSDSKIVDICYKASEPNIGLSLTRDGNALKCYMADTGLLISKAFDESTEITSELYRLLMFDSLSFNEGMILENIVSQMLVSTGRRNYFFSSYSDKAEDRMEIDFLVCKASLTSRHNIHPIEVKSGKNYTFTSLKKFSVKYKDFLSTPYIVHESDYKEENGIVFLPVYMVPLI